MYTTPFRVQLRRELHRVLMRHIAPAAAAAMAAAASPAAAAALGPLYNTQWLAVVDLLGAFEFAGGKRKPPCDYHDTAPPSFFISPSSSPKIAQN